MSVLTNALLLASSSGSATLQLIGGLVAFVLIMFGAYYAAKFLGRGNIKALRGKNLDVVESRAVGVGASVSIVRAGKSFFLIGVTKERVNVLSAISADEIELKSNDAVMTFQGLFSRFMKKEGASYDEDN